MRVLEYIPINRSKPLPRPLYRSLILSCCLISLRLRYQVSQFGHRPFRLIAQSEQLPCPPPLGPSRGSRPVEAISTARLSYSAGRLLCCDCACGRPAAAGGFDQASHQAGSCWCITSLGRGGSASFGHRLAHGRPLSPVRRRVRFRRWLMPAGEGGGFSTRSI